MDPREFYDTAKRLMQGARSEGDRRSCISRAYYSVYLTLNSVFQEVLGGDGIEHKGARDVLSAASDPDIQCLGDELTSFWDMRKRADYRMHLSIGPSHARDAIETANRMFADIGRIGRGALRAFIKRHYGT